MKKIKAISLFSGGLDSILATKIIMEQGIEVIGVTFKSPFYPSTKNQEKYANQLGITLKIIEFGNEYLKLILNPKYGYGKNMNPCIDCHAYMFKKAGIFMKKLNASFLITGEVKGERPMSQNQAALKKIEEESGLTGKILRPLSAKLLSPTEPEIMGYVNREKLYGISGRGRKPQFALAKKYNITEYPSPAGGCKLTDPAYSHRLRELITHNEYNMDNVLLLNIGRHLRLPSDTKLIVGRHKEDNDILKKLRYHYTLLEPKNIMGPVSLLYSNSEKDTILAAKITLSYSDHTGNEETISIYKKKEMLEIDVMPIDRNTINKYLIRMEK